MICISGREVSNNALSLRLNRHGDYINEIRLDLMDERLDLGLIRDRAGNIILSLGASTNGRHPKYLTDICEEATRFGLGYIDMDIKASESEEVKELLKHRGATKIIYSAYLKDIFDEEFSGFLKRANESGGDIAKVVVEIRDAADMTILSEFRKRNEGELIILGAGWRGALTTIRYKDFGSLFAYACLDEDLSSFYGELSLDEALRFGAGATPPPILLGVTGGEQVKNSSGYRVYNKVFRVRDMNFAYLRLPTAHIKETVELIRRFKFRGLSVTMPHKQTIMPLLDKIDERAARVGAVNNITNENGVLTGYNTDVDGVSAAFLSRTEIAGMRAAVLGAGGAARAAVCALTEGGAKVTVYNRNIERAKEVAKVFKTESAKLKEFPRDEFDILINATSIGMDSDESPVKNVGILKRKTVLDMVYHPARTRLIRESQEAGALITIPGTEVWLQQGLLQLKRWTGVEFSRSALERAMENP
ncbi:MAG: hypothetical protein Kow0090_17770 [Myxococcota bacterium]